MIACRIAACLGCVLLVTGGLAAPAGAQDSPRRYDVVLRGGSVHVGDGSEPVVANVAIADGKIAAIGPQAMEAGLVLDCTGLVVCPGFIDLHNHSDGPILGKLTRSNANYLLQGCTTVVTGNCGGGPINVGAYLKKIDDQGAGTHIAHLLPQGSLRDDVMGKANRKPTDEELAKMRDLAERAMQDGAFGMSTGLIYIPGLFTETGELIEIAKVVGRHGGIYASHIRGEGKTLLDAVQEAIRIGEEAGTPTHISHFKASGKPYWGTLRLAIQLVEAARAKGLTVTADQYPYIASSTSLDATLLPGWAREGGRTDLKQRLEDPETFRRIRDEVADKLKTSSRIQIASCRYRPAWVGKSIQEIAAADGREVVDVVMEIEKNGGAAIVNFGMSEEDVRSAMPLAWVATASDGGAKIPTSDQPHPRSFGTFPRKIGRYAIDENVLSLAAAIRSSSGLPAEILGLTDRGLLQVGLAADVAVFDPQTFRDRATFERPDLPAVGIRHVLVEGVLAVYDGQATGALAGHALRKTSSGAKVASKRGAEGGQRSEVGGQKDRAASPTSDLRSPTSVSRPADWAVKDLTALVQHKQGQGETFSIDFKAYRDDLTDLPIGVFDSGIGGLTVLQALLTSDLHDNRTGKPGADGVPDLVNERFLYLGDQANMPYGNYPQIGREDYLRELILKDALFLLGNRHWTSAAAAAPRFDKPPVKAIVIACNTATAYGLEDLRAAVEAWGLPVIVVGVVEAGANSAVELLPSDGKADVIAVLATTGTCSSGAYPRAIQQIAGRRGRLQPEVCQQGSLCLAGVIEGDPAFLPSVGRVANPSVPPVEYRGPSVANPQAPLDPALVGVYGFDSAGLLGDPARPETWRLNSVENYIRYDVATLVERYRAAGGDRPIGYVMLGCTHFPFEAERIRAAFARLRDVRDAEGRTPYRGLIAEQVTLIDPAQLTAKELYRALFLARRLARSPDEFDSTAQQQPDELEVRGRKSEVGHESAAPTSDLRAAIAEDVVRAERHRLYVSVPAGGVAASNLTSDGWFTHDYKYAREAGRFAVEDARIVPLRPERMPPSIRTLIESRCPEAWRALTQAP